MISAMPGPGTTDLPHTSAALEQVLRKGAAEAPAVLSLPQDGLIHAVAGRATPQYPLLPETIVPWSSAGQPAPAVACLRMVAAGTLALDAPVHGGLPDFRRQHLLLRLRHLLTHTASVDEKGRSPRASSRHCMSGSQSRTFRQAGSILLRMVELADHRIRHRSRRGEAGANRSFRRKCYSLPGCPVAPGCAPWPIWRSSINGRGSLGDADGSSSAGRISIKRT